MNKSKIVILAINFLNSYFPVIINFVVSFLIVQLTSIDLWGSVAYYLAITQVLSMCMSWGSKDYLLRAFSIHPAQSIQLWQSNVLVRSILAIIILILSFIFISSEFHIVIVIWLLFLFISKSYEVLIYYNRKFSFSIIVEFASLFLLLILIWVTRNQLSVLSLLVFFCLTALLKTVVYILYFRRNIILTRNITINATTLWNAVPFFILTLIGILNMRIDIFCINYFMDKSALGYYQIFMSFLLIIQGLAYMLVEPFTKNIYRIREISFQKINRYLIVLAPIISFLGLIIVYVILTYLYKIEINNLMLVYGFLFCVPAYLYSMSVYRFFKHQLEHWVIIISVLCICINIGFNFILIPKWGLTGVIFTAMICQWIKWIAITILNRLLTTKLNKLKSITAQ